MLYFRHYLRDNVEFLYYALRFEFLTMFEIAFKRFNLKKRYDDDIYIIFNNRSQKLSSDSWKFYTNAIKTIWYSHSNCDFAKLLQNILLPTGSFIFIDMDSSSGMTVPIRGIPVELKDFQSDKVYYLIGVGHYSAGHYIAFCRLQSGDWIEINDLLQTDSTVIMTEADLDRQIQPHLYVYKKN